MQEQDQNILAVNEQSINNKIDKKIKKRLAKQMRKLYNSEVQ